MILHRIPWHACQLTWCPNAISSVNTTGIRHLFRKCPLPGASNADGDCVSMTPSVGQAHEEEDFSLGLRTLLVRRAPTEHTSISNIRFGSRGKKSWKTNSNAISRLIRRSSDLSRCGEIQIWTDRSVARSSNPFINNCPKHRHLNIIEAVLVTT